MSIVYTPHAPDGRSPVIYSIDQGEEHGYLYEGQRYYRIQCSYWFGDWLETQDQSLWQAYGGRHRAIYIVREELLTLIHLKWI